MRLVYIKNADVMGVELQRVTMPWRHKGEWRYSSISLDLGGPRVGLDAVEKRKILHCEESNLGRPARSSPLYRLSYPDSWCQVTFMPKLLLRKRDEFSLLRPRFNPRIVHAIYLVEHGFVGADRVSPVSYHSIIAEYSPIIRDWCNRPSWSCNSVSVHSEN
jgi:hypothetical protein